MTALSKTWVCGHPLAGILGASNMEIGFLCVLCVVRLRSLRGLITTPRGVLPNVVRV